MTGAREAVLALIRDSLGGRATEDAVRADYAAIPRAYQRAGHLDAEARLNLFADRLRDYDAQVRAANAGNIRDAASAILQGSAGPFVVADGFPEEFLPSGVAFTPELQASVPNLDACAGVLTTCTVAIASSGTIVLAHGPGEGTRRLTLVPDRHICIVRASQVVETLPEAMDQLAPLAASRLTFISGPSATADIEMTRIRGVHGPRHLEVVLVH